MARMEIVDAQIHGPLGTGWLAGHEHLDQAGKDALAVALSVASMDAVGVDAAVIAPTGGADALGFPELAIKLHPRRFAAVLVIPADMPDMAQQVKTVRDRPGFLGIRITETITPPTVPGTIAGTEGIARLHAGVWEPAFAAAEELGITTQLFLAGQLQEAEAVLKAHPKLKVILIHFGLFRSRPGNRLPSDEPFKQIDLLVETARFPNVTVQLSHGPGLSKEDYPFRDVWPHLRRIIEAYGPERLLWGSDYTFNAGLFHYAEQLDYLRYTNEISERDKELILGQTVRRVYGWPRAQ